MQIEKNGSLRLNDQEKDLLAFWNKGAFTVFLSEYFDAGSPSVSVVSFSQKEAEALHLVLENPGKSFESLGVGGLLDGNLRVIEPGSDGPLRDGIDLEFSVKGQTGMLSSSFFIDELKIDALKAFVKAGLESPIPDAPSP